MRANEAAKRSAMELTASIAIYAAILIPAMMVGPAMEAGTLRTVVMLSPMLGFMLALWAVVRQLRRIDEFLRLRTLENIAMAAAVTAGATFTYGFLENVGYPRLSMFVVWPLMGAVWALVALLRNQLFDRMAR